MVIDDNHHNNNIPNQDLLNQNNAIEDVAVDQMQHQMQQSH